MKRIIINADDFGINEVVTSEIERHLLAGNVSSTTVMANGACLDEVKRFASQHPEFSFGVHLCLSEFDSLTQSEGLKRAGIIGEDGVFIRKGIFKIKSFSDEDIKAICDELNAQIDVISSLGFPVSHADSHHHVHTIFPLQDVFVDVLNARGIHKIRLGSDFRNWRLKSHFLLWKQRVKLNKIYRAHFVTTHAFYSYSEFNKCGLRSNEGTIELMCHPGHPDQQYSDEMKMVEKKSALQGEDIKLITYNELH